MNESVFPHLHPFHIHSEPAILLDQEITRKNIRSMKRAHLIETAGKKPEYDALRGFSRSIMNRRLEILC